MWMRIARRLRGGVARAGWLGQGLLVLLAFRSGKTLYFTLPRNQRLSFQAGKFGRGLDVLREETDDRVSVPAHECSNSFFRKENQKRKKKKEKK